MLDSTVDCSDLLGRPNPKEYLAAGKYIASDLILLNEPAESLWKIVKQDQPRT